MPDYSDRWWYIERPFPWPLIAAAALVVLVLAAITLGVLL